MDVGILRLHLSHVSLSPSLLLPVSTHQKSSIATPFPLPSQANFVLQKATKPLRFVNPVDGRCGDVVSTGTSRLAVNGVGSGHRAPWFCSPAPPEASGWGGDNPLAEGGEQ
ncbi:hypothetical protein Dsin_016448 [Dipteronia sinensis]|uniref:Uncharacterized protein n=1 Tax=Dipteronia sinensis TaxID=43782 RepID=A0AAE0AED5_9ROSI|nr:hypothetical protein Dsin_016448 [Dipteronia sinensis]